MKLFKFLPVWLSVPLFTVLVASIVYAAYLIVIIPGDVTVLEAITVAPISFTVNMYPAETYTETLTLTNVGSQSIEVNFTWEISPVDSELTVTVPAKVTVPATGSTTADIEIVASKSAIPQVYTISVGVTR